MKPKTTLLDDGKVLLAADTLYRDRRIVQVNQESKIRGAGVTALRCNENDARVTVYPTEPEDIQWLQAVHIAVRSGDFFRLSALVPNGVTFGLMFDEPVFDWLVECGPGEPLACVINYMAHLWKTGGRAEIIEAQVEPSIMERAYAQAQRHVALNGFPAFFESLHNYNIDIGRAYLREDDWERIVKRGESDSMQRCESRLDVWEAWLERSEERWKRWGNGLAVTCRNKARERRKPSPANG